MPDGWPQKALLALLPHAGIDGQDPPPMPGLLVMSHSPSSLLT